MATVNKDFKIKNGLIVEGTNGTINGFDILTKDQADQDYITGLVGGSGTSDATANTLVLRDGNGSFSANVVTADIVGTVSDISNHDTDDLAEGSNLYFTNARAQAAVAGDITSAIDALDTDDIEEGVTNLYFSNARAQAAVADDISSAVSSAIDALDTDDIEEGTTNLYFSNARAQAAVAEDISSAVSSAIDALDTDDIEEGLTNLYFSNTRARDAVSAGEGLQYNASTGEFTAHLGYGLEIANNAIRIDDTVVATDSDVSSAVSAHNVSSGVHGVTGDIVGTSDAQTLSNKVLGNAVTLGASIDAQGYTITDLGAPSQATDAATKAYVDSVAEGLHVHASVAAATTANVDIATELENGDILDGVTLVTGDRVLVKNQSSAAQNGIYVVQASGTALRASDYDTPIEIQGGDFVFVNGGTINADTGWVQTSTLVGTVGVDPIYFSQFSGAGTFTAGYGLYLDGSQFNVDANVIASLTDVANAVSDHSDLTTGVHGVTGDVVGTSDAQTLSNKTLGNAVALGANLDAVNTYTIANLNEPTNNQDAATKFYVDSAITGLSNTVSGLTTDDVSEGTNLYFTNARVEAAITNIDSDDITEGATNLYFSNARAQAAVADDISSAVSSAIDALDTDDIEEGLTNLYFTNARAEAAVANLDTDDLTEGSGNLYFTNARAEAAMVTPLTTGTQTNITVTYNNISGTYDFVAENGVDDSTTDDLDEGTSNLYFTNARAVAALEAITPNFVEVDINSLATQVAATTGEVVTAGDVTAYSWPKASYRSAEFLVKVAYSTHTEVSKVILTMDSSDNIAITEYAIVGTNGNASAITADVSGTDARLRVTTLNNNSTVTVVGTLLV